MMGDVKHTPEPWGIHQYIPEQIVCDDDHRIGVDTTCEVPDKQDIANIRRVLACVNACEGLNPEAIAEVCATLITLHETLQQAFIEGRLPADVISGELVRRTRAAIAKATGKDDA